MSSWDQFILILFLKGLIMFGLPKGAVFNTCFKRIGLNLCLIAQFQRDYTVTFGGKDDQQNTRRSDALQWTYHVSNLLRYSGNKNIVDKDQKKISQQKKIVSGLDYGLIYKICSEKS